MIIAHSTCLVYRDCTRPFLFNALKNTEACLKTLPLCTYHHIIEQKSVQKNTHTSDMKIKKLKLDMVPPSFVIELQHISTISRSTYCKCVMFAQRKIISYTLRFPSTKFCVVKWKVCESATATIYMGLVVFYMFLLCPQNSPLSNILEFYCETM